ncbi:MAG: hypothetical protein SW833_04995 [Cyanobacteriota bacterium]|nr:hypothetical protein [Cyanobacteriota bacterium]
MAAADSFLNLDLSSLKITSLTPEVLNDRNLLQKNAPNLVSWEREFQK